VTTSRKRRVGLLACVFAAPLAAASVEAHYVDQNLCAECHRTIAETYKQTGMARSFGAIRADNVADMIKSGNFRHGTSEEDFFVSERQAKAYLRRQQAGFDGAVSNVLEKSIDYWFGSGDHARSYFARDAAGRLYELPLTWYSESGGQWGMSPGYESARHAGFSRGMNQRCLFCHTAYPMASAAMRADTGSIATLPDQAPEGIDCQRCHGPGSAHIDAERRGERGAIVNPARLSAERRIEVCLQCHLETTNLSLPGSLVRYGRSVFSYRPGEPLADYALYFDHEPGKGYDDKFEFSSAPYRLFKSACYRGSRALTCTTCHDPHRVQTDPAHYSQVCRSCHARRIRALVENRRHAESEDCVSCHMAKRRPTDAIHVTITDHLIRRIPDRDAPSIVERNSANTPPYRGKVVLFYPPEIRAGSANSENAELYLALAQVKNQANLSQGIADLEKAIAKFRPARAEFYSDLGDAYRSSGQMTKAIALYREACSRDGGAWQGFHKLGMALDAAGDQDGASAALRRALVLAPDEPAVYEALAHVPTRQGHAQEAVSILRAGVRVCPESADLYNNLGAALLAAGDVAGAESALREAVRLRPELSAMQLNLANVLARNSHIAEARFSFERAIRLDPASAEAHSAYGTMLAATGDQIRARDEFRAALRLNPRLANTHNNLGTVLRQLDDTQGAVREYRTALTLESGLATAHYNLGVELAARNDLAEAERQFEEALRALPGYYEAHLELARMLCAQNRQDEALPHLRRAGESPNPQVRRAASELLRRAR
jgi:tetratricopeptide (TPR) repeat protein